MITKIGHFGLKIGALAAVLAVAAPALAQSHSGGGGGGHTGGGGGAHMSSGHGYSGGHAGGMGRSYGGRGFAGGSHFAPGAHYGYGGGYGHAGAWGGGGWHGGFGGGWRGTFWGGGYWGGGFWPRAYYGLGFSWFLPILPLAYATYWWDGVPFYYANNVYYTWNPSYDGYVATDPPPVNDGANAPAGSDGGGAAAAPMPQQMPPPSAGGAGGDQIFMYPKNGQSDAQLATDRSECQQWAASQAGGGRPDDYRRAMTACAEARGYSAK